MSHPAWRNPSDNPPAPENKSITLFPLLKLELYIWRHTLIAESPSGAFVRPCLAKLLSTFVSLQSMPRRITSSSIHAYYCLEALGARLVGAARILNIRSSYVDLPWSMPNAGPEWQARSLWWRSWDILGASQLEGHVRSDACPEEASADLRYTSKTQATSAHSLTLALN